ncbi:MAG: putative porin [Steroidobacter sp.]
MKNKALAAAIAAALCVSGGANAASVDELAQVREQLRNLVQRVDRLEQENAALKSQNDALTGQTPKTGADRAGEDAAMFLTGADWPSRTSVRGDVRYRHQQTDDARVTAERDEHLLRARVSVEAKATDNIVAGIGFSTSEGGNPRGANVRLDGEFSRKSLYIELGYVDWTFAQGAHAVLGKMRVPFVRPGQSLFWDNDVNPEGVAATYANGPWFGAGYGFWVEENVQFVSTPDPANDATDTKMYGVQFGRRFDLGTSNLVLGAMYYDLAAARGRRPFFNNSGNGNSMNASGGLAYDYQVVELMAEYNAKLAQLPLQLWLDFAQNQDAVLDTALSAGVLLGKAANPGSWEAGLAYQIIEKDALFAQHIDSDFAGGVTDSEGWILRAGYAPLKNWSLNATYFMTDGNVDVGNEFDYDRLLLDFNVKF